MVKIDELKSIWQNQKISSDVENFQENLLSDMIDELRKFEKKQDKRTVFKAFSVSLLLSILCTILIMNKEFTFFSVLGMSVIIISAAVFMYYYRKTQFKIEKLDMQNKSKQLIDSAISILNEQKKLFKEKFSSFIVGLITGLNVMYIDLLKDDPADERVMMHVGMSILILIGMYFGQKLRERIFKREFQPLIDELNEINKDLRE